LTSKRAFISLKVSSSRTASALIIPRRTRSYTSRSRLESPSALEAPLTKASFPARLNAGASVRTRALVFAATASPPDQAADSQVQPAEPAPEGDVLQVLGQQECDEAQQGEETPEDAHDAGRRGT